MKGRFFFDFLVMTLGCEIATEIREAGAAGDLTVDGVIASLDCTQVREYHGARCISEIDKRQREMYKAFDIPVPTEATRGEMIFDTPLTVLYPAS